MKKLIIYGFLLLLILSGCISIPEPSDEKNTLLVGKFLVNWNTTGKMKGGNGKYKVGIRIYFQSSTTGKIISVTTQRDGWLITNKLTEDTYTIQKFFIEQTYGDTTYQMTLNGHFFISITGGVVNNLGGIQMFISENGYFYDFVDHDITKYDFIEKFEDSIWNSYKWKEIIWININNKNNNKNEQKNINNHGNVAI